MHGASLKVSTAFMLLDDDEVQIKEESWINDLQEIYGQHRQFTKSARARIFSK